MSSQRLAIARHGSGRANGPWEHVGCARAPRGEAPPAVFPPYPQFKVCGGPLPVEPAARPLPEPTRGAPAQSEPPPRRAPASPHHPTPVGQGTVGHRVAFGAGRSWTTPSPQAHMRGPHWGLVAARWPCLHTLCATPHSEAPALSSADRACRPCGLKVLVVPLLLLPALSHARTGDARGQRSEGCSAAMIAAGYRVPE